MVATELLDLLSKDKLESYMGTDDLADRLSYIYSVIIILLLCLVVTAKAYVFEPLACYTSTKPGGLNFADYLQNYCWVHGTTPLLAGQRTPESDLEWDALPKINYYQWVPFILGLQCILFYFPRLLWQMVCSNRLGSDIRRLIDSAKEAVHSDSPEDHDLALDRTAGNLEMMLFYHRDNRTGRTAELRRRLYKVCSLCTVSKRMGTWLVVVYLLMKILYAANAVGQLFLIKSFMGHKGSLIEFGEELLSNLYTGENLNQTLIFPRKSYCAVRIRQLGTKSNRYIGQCALPINMLNEKIYVFLYFWILMVAIITIISIPNWFVKMGIRKNRQGFVKKFLRVAEKYDSSSEKDRDLLTRFLDQFLRQDGVFLLHMMSLNAGDMITSQVVTRLWSVYKEKYAGRNLNDDTTGKFV